MCGSAPTFPHPVSASNLARAGLRTHARETLRAWTVGLRLRLSARRRRLKRPSLELVTDDGGLRRQELLLALSRRMDAQPTSRDDRVGKLEATTSDVATYVPSSPQKPSTATATPPPSVTAMRRREVDSTPPLTVSTRCDTSQAAGRHPEANRGALSNAGESSGEGSSCLAEKLL